MRLVQVTLSEGQAAMIQVATRRIIPILDEEGGAPTQLLDAFDALSNFFSDVAGNPLSYPVRDGMMVTLRRRARALKGPAARPSRRNHREARKQRRKEQAKARRANR